jgi:hypothetical protein
MSDIAEERMQNYIDELEQENRLLRARNDRLEAMVAFYEKTEWPTETQVTTGAKALNKRTAEACGIDEVDQWKIYCEEFIEDSRIVLTAAFEVV